MIGQSFSKDKPNELQFHASHTQHQSPCMDYNTGNQENETNFFNTIRDLSWIVVVEESSIQIDSDLISDLHTVSGLNSYWVPAILVVWINKNHRNDSRIFSTSFLDGSYY